MRKLTLVPLLLHDCRLSPPPLLSSPVSAGPVIHYSSSHSPAPLRRVIHRFRALLCRPFPLYSATLRACGAGTILCGLVQIGSFRALIKALIGG